MKKTNWKSFSIGGLLAVCLLSGNTLGAFAATSSSDDNTPKIEISSERENSVILKVTSENLKKKKVDVSVYVKNNDNNGSKATKKVKATLDKNGTSKITVSGLDAGTSYTLKAKIKKRTKSKYSDYSSTIDAKTDDSENVPEIDSISSVTDSSVKLNISCNDLDNQTVTVQAAYRKKSSWTKRLFEVTLDDDGDGSVTIDGLNDDTEYSFKVRLRTATETTYTSYSSIERETTDEE